ncbi:MAG: hypothetical protein U9N86_02780 [Bacteroidota bacterium]|nr:hypothetical protein [Bacteroidota bacterium]
MKQSLIKLSALLVVCLFALPACDSMYGGDDPDTYEESEPNNNYSSATELIFAETFDAKISPAEDQDYFVYNSSSSVTITINGDSKLELYLYVYDENQINIYTGDTGARGASLNYEVKSSDFNGKFYIMVESAYPSDTGSYTIKIY